MDNLINLLGNLIIFADNFFDWAFEKPVSRKKILGAVIIYLLILAFFLFFVTLAILMLIYLRSNRTWLLGFLNLLCISLASYFSYKVITYTCLILSAINRD